MIEKLLFELGSEGRQGVSLPENDVPEIPLTALLPEKFLRKKPANLPALAEPDIVRHFVNLSRLNHHVDKSFYPLGSCTMKYNPKINENMARLPGFAQLHPLQPVQTIQGALQILKELAEYLCEISGFEAVTLQPSAGAHGELTSLMIVHAYHTSQGHTRKYVLIPDSAHGTNPATVSISGYQAIQIKSTDRGTVDLDELKKVLNPDVACMMLTNPNTLGVYESDARQIFGLLKEVGALAYMDGANLNALLGIVRPGDCGFDLMHFNLHKTFSTPHGGGGPGAGPVGVTAKLADFIPRPRIRKVAAGYDFEFDADQSIGKVSTFYGNFGVMVRAYTYIRMLGARGLRRVSENAIINANYLMSILKKYYDLPYGSQRMHEFVLSADRQKAFGVKALDIAKRLLDFGMHAPTVYFPLIVHEALMIEPTETESKESLDHFAAVMIQIAKEAEDNPELLHNAPVTTPVSRMDEARAARDLDIRFVARNS